MLKFEEMINAENRISGQKPYILRKTVCPAKNRISGNTRFCRIPYAEQFGPTIFAVYRIPDSSAPQIFAEYRNRILSGSGIIRYPAGLSGSGSFTNREVDFFVRKFFIGLYTFWLTRLLF